MLKKMFVVFISCMCFSVVYANDAKHKWGYEVNGPESWGKHYEDCQSGIEQSPVNIETSTYNVDKEISLNFQDGIFSYKHNGHTLKYTLDPLNKMNFMVVDGKKYHLLQLHFHSKSEHTLDGKSFPFEIHFVHHSDDGSYGVLGILGEEAAEGEQESPILSQLLDHADSEKTFIINPRDLAPADITDVLFSYDGSFTTPPCTEGVQWVVATERLKVSKETIEKLKDLIGLEFNDRPVQELNERIIDLSN